jgi:hypothetical protein
LCQKKCKLAQIRWDANLEKKAKEKERKRFTRDSGISVDPKKERRVKKEKRSESEMRESKKRRGDSYTAHAVVDYHHHRHPLISALTEREWE